MPDPNFFLIYVDNPTASAAFYEGLLERGPVATTPTFAMFALSSGAMLGLWSRHTVEPAATGAGGGELAFAVESRERVEALHGEWRTLGLQIAQPLTEMDFGYNFVALDPDGHRLRVFAPHKD